MKRYDTVLLDLDGTVTDSAPGILASVRYALKRFDEQAGGIVREWTDEELNFFIGPPLLDSFIKLIGCSKSESERCIAWYREYYTGKVDPERPGMLMNSVYDGMSEALSALRAAGIRIVLATAKPEPFARRILEHFGLSRFFDAIHGATLEEGRNRKAQVIAWALGHSGELGRVIMVGDRADDVKGAAANGLKCIGALWGYGSEEELREAGTDDFCKHIMELPQKVA